MPTESAGGGEGGGGGGLAFPIPGASVPGLAGSNPFNPSPAYGFGIGFPDVLGIGSKGFQIGPLLIPFGGPSAGQVTQESINRLRASRDPAIRTLASTLESLKYQGIDLSSSDPAARQKLGAAVHQAVLALEAQGIPRVRAYNEISNVISHGASAAGIMPQSVRPTEPFARPTTFAPTTFSANLGDFISGFTGATGITPAQLGGAVGGALGEYVGSQVGFPAQGALVGDFIGQQMVTNPPTFQLQQAAPTTSFPPSGPQASEVLPPLQDCPECGFVAQNEPQYIPPLEPQTGLSPTIGQPQPQPLQELQQESQQLQQETQVEEQQATQQQIGQIQQALDQLQQLEAQPVGGRNIQQELQQKAQLQSQIQQLIAQQQPQQQLPGTQPQTTPGQPLPPLQLPQPQPISPQPISPQPQEQPQPVMQPVRFCVDCTSVTESHKFLNGEASECTIAP